MKKISRLLTITACGAALGAPLQALPSLAPISGFSPAHSAERSSLSSTTASPEDLCKKGENLYNAQKYTEAVNCFLPAAEKGHAAAQTWLGECYELV